MNRGRHKKQYPKEVNDLLYKKEFKQIFTPEESRALLNNIQQNTYPGYQISLRDWEENPKSATQNIGFLWIATKEGYTFWRNKIHAFTNLIIKNKLDERIKISNQK